MIKRIALIALLLLAVGQFFQPDRSVPASEPTTDLLVMTDAPADIRALVQGACYDCHSYNTTYPFYAHITPINWWLQDHINDGRKHMNFSRWDTYATNKHASELGEVIEEGEMPPGNYALIHSHAKLTPAQQAQLTAWFEGVTGKRERKDEED